MVTWYIFHFLGIDLYHTNIVRFHHMLFPMQSIFSCLIFPNFTTTKSNASNFYRLQRNVVQKHSVIYFLHYSAVRRLPHHCYQMFLLPQQYAVISSNTKIQRNAEKCISLSLVTFITIDTASEQFWYFWGPLGLEVFVE